LANEPEKGGEGVFQCVVRLPTGARISRNFLRSDRLQFLHDWIYVQDDKGFENNENDYQILSGYPPKEIDSYDKTIGEMFPQNKNNNLFTLKEKGL